MLAASKVCEVVVVGRRGPAQAAFTNPELLELGELADADVIVDSAELERALAVEDPAAAQDATCRRNVEILRAYAEREPAGHRKRIVLRFLLSPVALLPGEHGHLGAVELVRNELVADPGRWPARAGHRGARDDRGGSGVPGDRLPRPPPSGRAVRRALGGDPQRGRPRARPRDGRAAPGRVRRGMDQAGALRA